MTQANQSSFVYVTFIRTTPQRLWSALTDPEQMKEYWFGMRIEADWKAGGPWKLIFPDGRTADSGQITEFDPPSRMVIRWRHELSPELQAEGYSRCTMELEPVADTVKLTITHAIDRADSQFIGKVSGGWPRILSNLKSLLETGQIILTR